MRREKATHEQAKRLVETYSIEVNRANLRMYGLATSASNTKPGVPTNLTASAASTVSAPRTSLRFGQVLTPGIGQVLPRVEGLEPENLRRKCLEEARMVAEYASLEDNHA